MGERIYYHNVNNLTPTVAEPMNGAALDGLPIAAYDHDWQSGSWKCDQVASDWFQVEGDVAERRRFGVGRIKLLDAHGEAMTEHVERRIQFFYLQLALAHRSDSDFYYRTGPNQGGRATHFLPQASVSDEERLLERHAAHSAAVPRLASPDRHTDYLPYSDIARVFASTVTVPVLANQIDSQLDGDALEDPCQPSLRADTHEVLGRVSSEPKSPEEGMAILLRRMRSKVRDLVERGSPDQLRRRVLRLYDRVSRRALKIRTMQPEYFGQLLFCRCTGAPAQRQRILRHVEQAFRLRQLRLNDVGRLLARFVHRQLGMSQHHYFERQWFHGAFVDKLLASPDLPSVAKSRLKTYWNYRGPQASWLPVAHVYDRRWDLDKRRLDQGLFGGNLTLVPPPPGSSAPSADYLVPFLRVEVPSTLNRRSNEYRFLSRPLSGPKWDRLVEGLSDHVERIWEENEAHKGETLDLLTEIYGKDVALSVKRAYKERASSDRWWDDEGSPRFPVDPYIFQLHVVPT